MLDRARVIGRIGPTGPTAPITPIGPLCPLCAHVRNFPPTIPGYVPRVHIMPSTLVFFKNGHIGLQMGARKVLACAQPTRVPTNENSPYIIVGVFIGGLAWAQLRNMRNCCRFIGAHVGTRGHTWAHGPTWAHLRRCACRACKSNTDRQTLTLTDTHAPFRRQIVSSADEVGVLSRLRAPKYQGFQRHPRPTLLCFCTSALRRRTFSSCFFRGTKPSCNLRLQTCTPNKLAQGKNR